MSLADHIEKREIVVNQLKEGDIVENRYKVLKFQKDCGWNLPSGTVWDLCHEKIKKINDVKIDHWNEPKVFEIVKKIGMTMNEIDHPNLLKKDAFAIGPNGRLYRIARHLEETPEEKSLHNLIFLRSLKKEFFTEKEILDVIYAGSNALKYLNSMKLDIREKISAKSFFYLNGTVKLLIEYWNLTLNVNKTKFKDPPLNITLDFLWNLGGIIYEMATLKVSGIESFFRFISKEKLFSYQNAKLMSQMYPRLPEFPQTYSLNLNKIYERLIEVIQEMRPTPDEILEMIEGKPIIGIENIGTSNTQLIEPKLNSKIKTERKSSFCILL